MNYRFQIPVLVASIVAGLTLSNACGQEDAASESSLAAYYMGGMWSHCEKIQTGECQVKSSDGTRYSFLFDFLNDRIRYQKKSGERNLIYSKASSKSYVFTGSGAVQALGRNEDSGIHDASPFDVRLLGLISQNGNSMPVTVDQLRRMTKTLARFNRIEKLKNGRVKVVFEADVGSQVYEHRFLIDVEKDFAPVGMRTVSRTAPGGERQISATNCELNQIGDLWLPTECELHYEGKPSISFQVNWGRINEPIDDRSFEPEGLDLPSGTSVVSRVRDEFVTDRVLISEEPPIEVTGTIGWWPIILCVNLLLLTLGVVLIAKRRG